MKVTMTAKDSREYITNLEAHLARLESALNAFCSWAESMVDEGVLDPELIAEYHAAREALARPQVSEKSLTPEVCCQFGNFGDGHTCAKQPSEPPPAKSEFDENDPRVQDWVEKYSRPGEFEESGQREAMAYGFKIGQLTRERTGGVK